MATGNGLNWCNMNGINNCPVYSVISNRQQTCHKLSAFRGESFRIRIRGSCMHPVLPDGEFVSVKPSDFYLPGDIIVFEADFGEILSHRLIGRYTRKGKHFFLTQADNAANADKGIEKDRVLGKIQTDIPVTKRLLSLGRFIHFTGKWILRRAIR